MEIYKGLNEDQIRSYQLALRTKTELNEAIKTLCLMQMEGNILKLCRQLEVALNCNEVEIKHYQKLVKTLNK